MSGKQNRPVPQSRRGGPFGGPPHAMGAGEKPKNFESTILALVKYMRRYWLSIIMVFAFAIAGTVFAIYSPKVTGGITNRIVDDIMDMMFYDSVHANLPGGMTLPDGATGAAALSMIGEMPPEQSAAAREMIDRLSPEQLERLKNLDLSVRPSIDFNSIGKTILFLLCLFLLSSLSTYIQSFVMTGVSQKVSYSFRKDISEKINRMPLGYFDTRTHGEVLSRVTNDVDTISQTLNQSLSQLVSSATMVSGILVMMLTISWQLTLVAVCVLPVSFGVIALIVSRSQKYFKSQQESLGELNGHIEECYSAHNVIKAFNAEKASIEQFGRVNARLYGSAWKSQFLSGLMMPLMNFIGNLGYVGICIVGGWLAVNGTLKVGDIQAFIQYVRQFTHPVAQLAMVANTLQSTAAAAERVFEFLAEEEELPDSGAPVRLETVRGDVDFSDVVFGYSREKVIIKGFSAHIKAGSKVAIVGPTGAGKTTMVNLLMRFYDVDGGSIRLDGVDIRDMKRAELRNSFGMVLQDTWLFNGSIEENIRYGRVGASDEDVRRAAKSAQADHFIHSMPGGYGMEINEEATNISQGQKQLLTIARAMLADPPILILDEATSSVDTRTEVLIKRAMDNLMAGRTCFIIAHRLSTIRDADMILVMKDGNIVEQGTHQELLMEKGFYGELYSSQFASAG